VYLHTSISYFLAGKQGMFCRSSFATLPPVLLLEQPAVVLLLERALVSWSSAIEYR
jgi:hypothetical protein